MMFKRGDILILVIIIAALALCFAPRGSGETAAVYSDGALIKELPLDTDAEFTVKSGYGVNTVVIKDGAVYVTDADCPDKICEKSAPIKEAGSAISCLPNRLSVKINGGKKYDAVVR